MPHFFGTGRIVSPIVSGRGQGGEHHRGEKLEAVGSSGCPEQLGVPLPTTAATNEYLSAARGLGLADKDFAVIIDVLARMAGMDESSS